jgi:RNA polymerase sigma factor (sigma-70 family)
MKKITNEQVINRFKEIKEYLVQNPTDDRAITTMQNKLINDLAFLVGYNTKQYRYMPNYEDLNQEGMVGLIKAVRIFDYTRFPNFFVFANQWIVNGVKRAAKKHDVVYNPNKKRVLYKTDEEMENLLVDDRSLDDAVDEERVHAAVGHAVGALSKRDRVIVSKIFGFDGDEHTLRDLESCCGLSYERIRQLKNKALEKLKFNKALGNIIDS